ncbi:MAG: aminotransferase class I/II-fold pyridoxal phosphate-dependent enzyme, partial [Actinomycetes bacterium]
MRTTVDVFAKVKGHDREQQINAARESGVLPYFRPVESPAAPVVEMEGAERVMLGSNNYLGLTGDPRVIEGARQALEQYGTGLTGSRLLNGTTPLHTELEAELATWMGSEDCIVYTTGQQANLGALGTLLAPSDTVVTDSAAHASILDGIALSRAKLRAYRHNKLDKLERQLERASGDGGGILVVAEGMYSMEGDVGPLAEIAELAKSYGARMMVDEAHSVGVLGARGTGATELFGIEDRVDLRMGTFSKSFASCGGFIAGSRDVIEYLRVTSRSYIFTASAVPAALGAAQASLRIMASEEGPLLFAKLLDNARYLHAGLVERGFKVVTSEGGVITPVVPILVEDDWKAVLLWKALYDAGLFVNVALHPAVPPGGALLRTSVMATHDREVLDRALEIMSQVKSE